MKIGKIIKKESKKNRVVLGIVGGSSIKNVFRELRNENIDWSKIHIFMVDERKVNLKNKYSNFRLARESLFDFLIKKGKILESNLHPYDYNRSTGSYYEELKKYGGRFDIVILSAGEDGHVASLFPGYSIKNNSLGFIDVNRAPKIPKKRISASRKLIEKSRIGVLLFGKGKNKAYKMFLDDKLDVNDCPAKVINKIKKRYVIKG